MSQPARPAPVVLFGASGFVGTHVRRLCARLGLPLTIVSRRPLATSSADERHVAGDLRFPQAVASALPARAVIVNLAFDAQGGRDTNLAMADGLADLCQVLQAQRLVHVSTAMVVGRADERLVTEQTACHPRTAYQQIKRDVETRLGARLSGQCPLVVLRPTAVFGEGGLNLRKLVSDLTTRPAAENYLRACLFGTRAMNLVPVETVAAAVAFAVSAELAVDAVTWLVADDEDPANNFRDVERQLREALGLPERIVPVVAVPAGLLAAVLKTAGRLPFDPRTRFSSAAIEAAGFVRPVRFREALAAYGRAAASESRG